MTRRSIAAALVPACAVLANGQCSGVEGDCSRTYGEADCITTWTEHKGVVFQCSWYTTFEPAQCVKGDQCSGHAATSAPAPPTPMPAGDENEIYRLERALIIAGAGTLLLGILVGMWRSWSAAPEEGRGRYSVVSGDEDDTIHGRYDLQRRIGSGGFANVHLAKLRCPDIFGEEGSLRAIKIIDTSKVEGTASERRRRVELALEELNVLVRLRDSRLADGEACCQLGHPNVLVPIETFSRTLPDGGMYAMIVMDYFPNGDLRRLVNKQWPFRDEQIMEFAWDLASALDFLHNGLQQCIVHRDLKPENVLVRNWRDGLQLVVTDFGLGKLLKPHQSAVTRTWCGTLWAAAPEALHGHCGPAIDLWSLGCVLYAVATGRVNHSRRRENPDCEEQVRDDHPQEHPESTYTRHLYGLGAQCAVEDILSRESPGMLYPCTAGLVADLLSPAHRRPSARDVLRRLETAHNADTARSGVTEGCSNCSAEPGRLGVTAPSSRTMCTPLSTFSM
eukprot:TRINITY_DN1684_c0_g1_i1.p1 TRINITY_DN1684_c0_g1~~TRINITY_DN1684_c0_g1_i1.p1  ORF type:complete len:505 (+),score=44.27 TRINITY_DN1684_c0_g1_i1:89-1603(+)